MLTRLVANFYSWLIEITLWLFVAGGAFWGYQLGRRMRGDDGAFYGGLFGAAGAFVTSAVIFGGFLLLDEIRKSVRNIEKAQNLLDDYYLWREARKPAKAVPVDRESATDAISKAQTVETAVGSQTFDASDDSFEVFHAAKIAEDPAFKSFRKRDLLDDYHRWREARKPAKAVPVDRESATDALIKVKRLFDANLISEVEYETKKQEILQRL